LINEQIYDFAGKSGDDPKTITLKSFMTTVVGQKGKISTFFQNFPTSEPNVYKNLPDTIKTSIKEWSNYPCVTNSLNVKPFLTKQNYIAFVGGGYNWFANGRRGNITSGEIDDFYCEGGKTVSGLGGWKKFPCVFNNPSAIDYQTRQKPTEKSDWIEIGKIVYGKVGKKFTDGDNQNQTNYTCETETSLKQGGGSTGGGTNQVAGGTILAQVVTPQVVTQLRTLGGLTDTAQTLTQKDINDLYTMFYNQLPKK
jgi:hypothetical protein